jgi:hypothetical protein
MSPVAEHFFVDPDAVLDPDSPLQRLSAEAFRWGWFAVVAAAARREDTFFDSHDLDELGEHLTPSLRAVLVEHGFLVVEGHGWRLSSYGWRIENEGA